MSARKVERLPAEALAFLQSARAAAVARLGQSGLVCRRRLRAGGAFAAGLKVPARLAFASRIASATLVVAAAVAVTILANVALFRHDAHLDLTHEKAFTPSAEAREVVRRLSEPVDVAYFYQKQNPAARALGAMLRQLERQNANFRVRVDRRRPEPGAGQQPGCANLQFRRAAARRTPRRSSHHRRSRDRARRVAAAAQREMVICFASGHGEYDIDNFEFHTHFEGAHSHSHDASGIGGGADGAARPRPAAARDRETGPGRPQGILRHRPADPGRLRCDGRSQSADPLQPRRNRRAAPLSGARRHPQCS